MKWFETITMFDKTSQQIGLITIWIEAKFQDKFFVT